MNTYLQETNLLDYNSKIIQDLIKEKKWKDLKLNKRINQIYLFVRDEILFGYNEKDEIKASQVLKEKMGQCNTKSSLLMALLRASGIECRFHGFTIEKSLQKGAFSSFWFKLAPKNIIHSWVEVKYNNHWYNLEGVILDKAYLSKLQEKFKDQSSNFCGYGVFTEDLQNPEVDWNQSDTYIQKLGINQDFGLFDDPDSFFNEYSQDISFIKKFMFKNIIRKSNNKNILSIRKN